MEPVERLDEMEIRYTELERLVHELSDVVYKQQKELDALAAAYHQLKARFDADPGLVDASVQEKPPHY